MPWVVWEDPGGKTGVDLDVLVVSPARAVAGPFATRGEAKQAEGEWMKRRAEEADAAKKQMRLWGEGGE